MLRCWGLRRSSRWCKVKGVVALWLRSGLLHQPLLTDLGLMIHDVYCYRIYHFQRPHIVMVSASTDVVSVSHLVLILLWWLEKGGQ
jgi:hypothetical protein